MDSYVVESNQDWPADAQGAGIHNQRSSQIPNNLLSNVLQTVKLGNPQKKGILIGAGLLPIPANLANRILKWEYAEMVDLIPYI